MTTTTTKFLLISKPVPNGDPFWATEEQLTLMFGSSRCERILSAEDRIFEVIGLEEKDDDE